MGLLGKKLDTEIKQVLAEITAGKCQKCQESKELVVTIDDVGYCQECHDQLQAEGAIYICEHYKCKKPTIPSFEEIRLYEEFGTPILCLSCMGL